MELLTASKAYILPHMIKGDEITKKREEEGGYNCFLGRKDKGSNSTILKTRALPPNPNVVL
jgi:hypothetical protein